MLEEHLWLQLKIFKLFYLFSHLRADFPLHAGHLSPFCFHILLKPTEPANPSVQWFPLFHVLPSAPLVFSRHFGHFHPAFSFRPIFLDLIQPANTFYEPNSLFSRCVYRFGGRYWFASLDLSHHSLPLSPVSLLHSSHHTEGSLRFLLFLLRSLALITTFPENNFSPPNLNSTLHFFPPIVHVFSLDFFFISLSLTFQGFSFLSKNHSPSCFSYYSHSSDIINKNSEELTTLILCIHLCFVKMGEGEQ